MNLDHGKAVKSINLRDGENLSVKPKETSAYINKSNFKFTPCDASRN